MKKGIVIVGVILLVIGLVMMLFMWPLITDAETPEDFAENSMEGKYGSGDTAKIIGKVTDVIDTGDSPTGKAVTLEGGKIDVMGQEIEIPFPIPEDFDVNEGDTVILEYKMTSIAGEVVPTEVKAMKVPTLLGIIGLILLIVGVILLIVGAVTGRAAPVAPAQPPMEQPPYQQPIYQQPPMQQPPYQQPPPQQPPMPPPPPPR